MTLDISAIPDSDATTSTTEKTSALSGLGSLAKRRTVLRGMALSGATVGAVALGWSPLSKASTAKAETSPTGLTGWDANDCKDAYPNGYNENPDTEGAYVNQPAACFGGSIIGSTMCDSYGWHKTGYQSLSWVESVNNRAISSACGATTTKNAWRWTVNGTTYRCSDGVTTYYYWGWGYSYLTICRAKV